MQCRDRIHQALSFLSFAFYPKPTLIACTVFSWIIIVILGAAMTVIPRGSGFYDLVFALTTGAVGSSIVSLVVELSSNCKHNKLAFHQLRDYYNTVLDHELYKQVLMQQTPSQRAEKKAREEFEAAGGVEDSSPYDQPQDIIQITWERLPSLMPVFKATLQDQKEFLSDGEIDELESIVSEYKQIHDILSRHLMHSPLLYDALNHPDEGYLQSLYPADVLQNMPDWVRHHLASTESQKACSRYVEAILSDGFLLAAFTKDLDISQKGLVDNRQELDRREEEQEAQPAEDWDEDDFDSQDFLEPEDEEAFRAQVEQTNRELNQQSRPFASWLISDCCQCIARSIDILEKYIAQKPYYGLMIRHTQNVAREPLSGIFAQTAYRFEKKRLDKKLARQKGSAPRQ